ncbi:hypothetical protein [Salipiger thiooxidans]|uniref:hypothetical protein n=1 Tax=Salipiger thiooxidans TaxID=282683 RepID=UPI001CD5D879|nr:hypothetical protein [Salipiger thiooxidans]MCA0851195.1 hypothetical protein [Salipiger thiooxidans]
MNDETTISPLEAARAASAAGRPVVIHGPAGCGEGHSLSTLAWELGHETLDRVFDGWSEGDRLLTYWLYIATDLSPDQVRRTRRRGAHVARFASLAPELGLEIWSPEKHANAERLARGPRPAPAPVSRECECGERGLEPAEIRAERCALCDRDGESRDALHQAEEEISAEQTAAPARFLRGSDHQAEAEPASRLSCRHVQVVREADAWRCTACAHVLHAGEVEAVIRAIDAGDAAASIAGGTFQGRVAPWMQACFGAEVSADRLERGDRLLEEVLELLQSGAYPRERVAQLTGYVWSRGAGEPAQEVGGVMVTLAAYCEAHGIDMHAAGDAELARVWDNVEKIRAKRAAKPTGSALPQAWPVEEAPDMADLWGEFFQAALVQFRAALAVGHYEAAAILLAALEAIQAQDTGALAQALGDWCFPGMRALLELAPAALGFASDLDEEVTF